MTEPLLGILILLPYILAVLVSALCWRSVAQRLLFFLTATLSLAGLQGLVAPAAISVFLPIGGGFSNAAAHEAFTHTVIMAAIIQLTVGVAFLWWLYRAFRKP